MERMIVIIGNGQIYIIRAIIRMGTKSLIKYENLELEFEIAMPKFCYY